VRECAGGLDAGPTAWRKDGFPIFPLVQRLPIRRGGRRLGVLLLVCLAIVDLSPARAANWVAGDFDLDQLIGASGEGTDPGPRDLQARLDWAVRVAVPLEWRVSVPVRWEWGDTGRSHLALSYFSGEVVVSPRVITSGTEALLATVAHEMGHQITFRLVPPGDGSPPPGFDAIRGGGYRDLREAWADCVSRAWTGSLNRTTSEPKPCPEEAADWVASILADPSILGGRVTVRVRPRKPPPVAQPVLPVPTPPSPIPEQPETPPKVERRIEPQPKAVAVEGREGPPISVLVGIVLVGPAIACLGGFYLIKSRMTQGVVGARPGARAGAVSGLPVRSGGAWNYLGRSLGAAARRLRARAVGLWKKVSGHL
jgi:hypothetical protein